MNIGVIAISGAAALFLASTIFVGSKELSLLQFSQLSAARQLLKLSGHEVEPGYSQLSEFIVLKGCRDAMTRILGRLQPATRRDRVAENCFQISNRITRAAPTSSFAHFVEAVALYEKGDYGAFNDAYVRSQVTGPNEAWIAQGRFYLAERAYSELTQISRLAHENDLATLAQSRFGLMTIAAHYVRTPDFRERITAVLETLTEADQRRFLSAIKSAKRGSGAGS